MKVRLLSALGAFLFFGASAGAEPRPVVVELFTSQGCSSCPPADRFVGGLADQPGLIVLAFHVGYWDHLGWADNLAIPAGTARQYSYRDSLQSRMVFTPQVVVDGRESVRGTDQQAVLAAIEAARARGAAEATMPITAERLKDGRIVLRFPADSPAGPAPVWLVEVEDRREVVVKKGENAGHTYVYRRPVRAVQRVGEWDGKASEMVAKVDALAPGRIAIFLAQGPDGGPIRAAGILP